MPFQGNIIWYNRSDDGYSVWETNFSKKVSEYEAQLGVDAGELEEIQDAGIAYQEALANVIEAKASYEASVINKNNAKLNSINVNRKYVAQFQAIPNLSEEVFQSLDIPARHTSGTRSAAATPSGLIATAQVNGGVTLKYARNGNSQSTTFTIQQSDDEGATWSNIYSSSKTRVNLAGYTPGVSIWFRVFATRNNTSSAPTQPVVIWANGSPEFGGLEVAA